MDIMIIAPKRIDVSKLIERLDYLNAKIEATAPNELDNSIIIERCAVRDAIQKAQAE